MRYDPTFPSQDVTAQWIYEELTQVARSMDRPTVLTFAVSYAPPEKIEDGMVLLADGTSWNPGAGAGVYARIAGAWVKL